MSNNEYSSSIAKIFLTTTVLVVTALPAISYTVKANQQNNIHKSTTIYKSPCHQNPTLPQC